MARSFDELPVLTSQMANRMDAVVTKLVKKAASTAGARAVETTRVDTGRARSNWIARIDTPARTVIPPYAPGVKLGIGERANARAAIAQQRAVIGGFNIRSHKAVYISNNTPYIVYLNNGGPYYGPGLMAQQAVQAAEVAVKGEKFLNSLLAKGDIGTFTQA